MSFPWASFVRRYSDPSAVPAGRGPGRVVHIFSNVGKDPNEPGPFGVADLKSGFDTFSTLNEAVAVACQRSEAEPGRRVFVYCLHGVAYAEVPAKPEASFTLTTPRKVRDDGSPVPGTIAF